MSENLLNLIVIILSSSTILLLFLWLNERRAKKYLSKMIQHDDLIKRASFGGYYFFNKQENTVFFSNNVFKILNANFELKDFTDLASLFDEKENLMILKQRLENYYIDDFMVNLKLVCDNETKIICCSGKRVENNSNQIVGIIVWFYDVSYYVNDIEKLNFVNDNLYKEIELYKSIFDKLPIAIWWRNKNLQISFCNKLYKNISQNSDVECKTNKCIEIDDFILEELKSSQEKPINISKQKYIIVDGDRKKFSINEVQIDPNHLEKGILGYSTDLTEKEKIKEQLKLHISAHSDLLESSSSAIAIYGANTELEFYNNSFVKFWGFSDEWLSSKPKYREILDDLRNRRKLPEQSDFGKFRDDQLNLFKDLIGTKDEFLYLPSGETYRVIIIPHALGGLLFAYEDLTDRIAMQSSYNTLVEVQKETINNLNEAIAVFSQDGRLKLYNPQYQKLWNYDKELLDRKPKNTELFEISDSLHGYEGLYEDFKKKWLKRPEGQNKLENIMERSDGKIVKKLVSPLPDGDFLVSYVDITSNTLAERSLKEKNEALEKADKLKADFLASVSYEFRTPLTSILGFSEVLKSGAYGKLNPKQHDYVESIMYSSYELVTLTSDIIDIMSIEFNEIALDVEYFDIDAMINNVMNIVQFKAKSSNIILNLKCEKNIGQMLGDEKRMKQLLYNLISNAIKFSHHGDEVKISIYEKSNDRICFKVSDNGIGIKQEDKSKIFEKFYRSEDSVNSGQIGTGIGLSVVKSVVDLHHGELIFDSNEGQGAAFYCIFDKCNELLLKNES